MTSSLGIFAVSTLLLSGCGAKGPSVTPALAQAPLTPEERKYAKDLDDDLAKQCRASQDECRRASSMLLLEAQVNLAEWGYGTKFTGEADALTVSALRLYQQRNGLVATGKLDGATVAMMDRDAKAVEAYPFTLPPFQFSYEYDFFSAMGVFRDTTNNNASGPIEIKCFKDWVYCFVLESTHLTPEFSMLRVKEWTNEHIIAEDASPLCSTGELRIERASKTVVYTTTIKRTDGPCEDLANKAVPRIDAEELVEGVDAQLEINRRRAAAVQRVKLFSGTAQSLIGGADKKKQ